MADLTGKVALVTGGSRGIGAATAKRLARDGAHVVITYLNSEGAAQEVVEYAQAQGVEAEAVKADAASLADVTRLVEHVVDRYGHLDILVNNAGIFGNAPIHETSDDDFDRYIDVNVRPIYVAMREAAKVMGEGGRIINIGSINGGHSIVPGMSLYAMSKAAVAALTRSAARDLGQKGITVNVVEPGPVDTDMNPADSEFAQNVLAPATALGRYGTPDEIAGTVAFLASDDSSYLTGSTLTVDGGHEA